jgi:O-acetyl-ADP-ribose deacetylase (regulator of RNase III)
MNLPQIIHLIDLDPHLVEEWQKQFNPVASNVVAKVSDYFDYPADAIVSPANSFGYMDGGLDRVISYELGNNIQQTVQSEIVKRHHGELPVGTAIIVKTNSLQWPYLVIAPTMRVPEDVSNTINAYLAFRAILLAIKEHNINNPKSKINSLICSGLATGIGNLSPQLCALQMRIAYEHCINPATVMSPREIFTNHSILKP